jgi:hypothetical protein
VTDPDAELMAAIAIEPPAPESEEQKTEEQKPDYFVMILSDETEKRPMSL